MTVCDLTHAYHETSGGIRTYVDAKRRYVLAHTEHRHVTVVPGPADAVRHDGRAVVVEVACPTIRGAEPYRWFSRPGRVLDALAMTEPDVVELGTFYMPTEWGPAFAYRRRQRRRGRPAAVAVQAHTDFASSYAQVYSGKLFGPLGGRAVGAMARTYTRRVLGAADLRLAPSPFQAETLATIGVAVETIPLGVDTDVFSPAAADPAVRAELCVPAGARLAVYVGRLDSEKRTATLVEAARRADADVPTVLAMVGEGPNRDELEAAEAAGAPIRVLPFSQDRAALARLLASADAYLTAGPHETFALSVIEAQACGLPVVGVRAGALVERVPPGTGFLGPVDDAGALADNFARAVAERGVLGPAGRELAVDQFSWRSSFDRLFRLYDRALGARPTPPLADRLRQRAAR